MYCTTVLRKTAARMQIDAYFIQPSAARLQKYQFRFTAAGAGRRAYEIRHLQITACDNSVSTSACPGVRPRFPPGQEPRHVADFCGVAAVSPFRELLPLVVRRHLLSGSVLLYTLYMTDAIFRPHPTSNLTNTKTNPNNSTILTVTA